ncbi:MAG: phosphate/phosphite/phosphonate ABC transporter substrate-binding protein [Candidatus Puniceispirillaceae bacterium]
MNDPRISLGMYPAPASAHIFAAIEQRLAAILDRAGVGQEAQAVRHMCGITLATAPAGRWRYLATPVIGDPAVPRGHYNSLIITPRDGGLAEVGDFDPGVHIAAINEPGSFSGAITLAAHLAGTHGMALTLPLRSGAHLESVTLVAKGKAQLAAIDRMSFSLARHDRPEDVAKVRVIGETAFHPAPPLVADASLDDGLIAALGEAVLDCPSLPEWPEMARVLGVAEMMVMDEALYPPMAAVMPRAA